MSLRSLLPLSFLVSALAPAQQLPIRTYTVADGLAEDRVNRIVADSHGYVWIATDGGLSRFDGYRMKTYGVEDGLPYRMVHGFLAMPSGAYLVGTVRGLGRLENHGARPFSAYPLDKQSPDVEDFLREPSGRILAGSYVGVFEVTSEMSYRKLLLDERVGTRVTALVRDHEENTWISSNRALGILSPGGQLTILQPGHGLPAAVGHIEAMAEQPPGRMWVGTHAGLGLFERSDGGGWRLSRMLTTADGLAASEVDAIEADAAGLLWLGTSEGISRFAPDGPLPPRFENLGVAQGLSGRRITALARDSAGNMWAGTETAGVMRIARQGFLTYRKQDGLNDERLTEVLEDRDGELLALTVGERPHPRTVSIFDGTGFQSFVPGAVGMDPSWGWQRILLQAHSGEWWGATEHGLVRFPPVKAAGLAAARPTRYPAHKIFHLFEDSSAGIWASANSPQGSELMRWDPGSQTLSWFRPDGTTAAQSRVFGDLVTAVAEDRSHNVWMGLWSGGLLRYGGGRFARFGGREGIPPGMIRSLLIDHRGWLWIATNGGGLALLADPSSTHPDFAVYNKARGLSSDSTLCIVEDAMGRLYVGTGRGVDRLDPETGHIRHFSNLDGVPFGGFTSAVRDRSGTIWFGSYTGLSRLLPESSATPRLPDALITSLKAGGEDYAISQLGESRIAGLRLGSSHNSMQVEFVAPGPQSGEDLRYKFQLTPADTGWSEPRAQHTVDYRNLAAGSYRFLVKAVDSEGRESASPAEVAFTILPPIWRRWWFELCIAVAALALAYGLHAYRLKSILAMEGMRMTIATDLHDDIGAGLAQIAVLSEVAQVKAPGDEPHSVRAMARAGNLARELTNSINDIVWSIRTGDESPESLTRRMREFAAEFLEPAGIDFSWRAAAPPAGLKLELNSRRQIFLVYKECVHNVVKHSDCRRVFVTFDMSDREAVMTVADDGRGWEGESGATPRGRNGLPNMRRRAQSLGGAVEFGARPGGGCQVTLRLPIRKRSFGGTVL